MHSEIKKEIIFLVALIGNIKNMKLSYSIVNIGNKYEPRYTFFNMNRNIEYFSLPEKSKTENIKNNLNKKNISINIDDNLYKLKTRQNLHFLKNLKYLEINGENLLDFEESREKKIKGNKILHKNEYLEYLYNKKLNKAKTFEPLYEEKIFAKNYNKLDFMKNSNLNSKFNYITKNIRIIKQLIKFINLNNIYYYFYNINYRSIFYL